MITLNKMGGYNNEIEKTEDVDANNLKSNANYIFPEGYTGNVSNMPLWIKQGGGLLVCKNWGNYETQVFYPYGESTVYIRSLYYYDNKLQWTNWTNLVTEDKLGGLTFSASGTTLTITDGTHTWTLEANS